MSLENCAKKIKFDMTKAALGIARSATKELDAASKVLKGVKDSLDVVPTKVRVSGSLHNKTEPNNPLAIEIAEKFYDADLEWKGEFVPGMLSSQSKI